MPDFTIPVAFSFRVSMDGQEAGVFQEITGLESQMPFDPIREGGENAFVHRLPTGTKHSNLALKRGLVATSSPFVDWCKTTLEGGLAEQVETRNVTVALVDHKGTDVAVWAVSNAWPVKWSVGSFDAMRDEIAIETVELAFANLSRTR